MKVSIITAVRNGEGTIARTIASVKEQTYAAIEHVIVDGASTDATPQVIERNAPRNCRMLSEPDRGVYDAFNKGLRLCTGDVVAYLNSGDTYSHAQVVQTAVAKLNEAAVDAVYGDVEVVDPADYSRVLRHYRSGRFSPKRVAWGFMPAHPALFLRKQTYERYGHYDPGYRIAGDFELVARLFCRHGISYAHVPERFAQMPIGGLSSRGLRSQWIITLEMRRACLQNGISTGFLRLALRFPIKATEFLFR
jgi:glycosyltransferase involved in cell wall biosynthesis